MGQRLEKREVVSFFPEKDHSPPHLFHMDSSATAPPDTVLSTVASSSAIMLSVTTLGCCVVERLPDQEPNAYLARNAGSNVANK